MSVRLIAHINVSSVSSWPHTEHAAVEILIKLRRNNGYRKYVSSEIVSYGCGVKVSSFAAFESWLIVFLHCDETQWRAIMGRGRGRVIVARFDWKSTTCTLITRCLIGSVETGIWPSLNTCGNSTIFVQGVILVSWSNVCPLALVNERPRLSGNNISNSFRRLSFQLFVLWCNVILGTTCFMCLCNYDF